MVAGRHVHVVYFDAVLAACDLLDDQAWDELTNAWAQLAVPPARLAALPLALSLRSWLEVLQGRLGSATSHLAEIEDIVSLTGSRGLLGSPAPAVVLRDVARRTRRPRGPVLAGRCATRTSAARASAWTTPTRRSPFSSSAPAGMTPPYAPHARLRP